MEVYLDGGWKENKDIVVRLRDPAGQSNLAFDPFANPESKSICYYIDLTERLDDPAGRPPSDSDSDTD